MLVIGVGNDFRCDDAVGLMVARAIREMNLPDVAVVESTGEGTGLMRFFGENDRVILIDAVYSEAEPGTIHQFAAHQRPLPTQYFLRSTHAFSVAEAVELARELQCLPNFLMVIGIEGESFGFGEGLSPKLDEALPTIIEQSATVISRSVTEHRIPITDPLFAKQAFSPTPNSLENNHEN